MLPAQLGTLYQQAQPLSFIIHPSIFICSKFDKAMNDRILFLYPHSAAISKLNYLVGRMATIHRSMFVIVIAVRMGEHKISY